MTHHSPLQTENSADSIRIVAEIPEASQSMIFDYWTRPELLKKWWPPEAELNPTRGRDYHFWWPKQNWHLRGKFTEVAEGERLGFTWKWDHESIDQTDVKLTLDPLGNGGTKLTVQHTGYSDDAEGRKIRDEHVEGWLYFLGRLQEICKTSSTNK